MLSGRVVQQSPRVASIKRQCSLRRLHPRILEQLLPDRQLALPVGLVFLRAVVAEWHKAGHQYAGVDFAGLQGFADFGAQLVHHGRRCAAGGGDAEGATLRVYLERYAGTDQPHDLDPETALAPVIAAAEELALITGGEAGPYSPYAVHLDGGDPGDLEPVREGLAAVQDEGSQLVARALTLAPLTGPDGGRWLDLCAGPGGKAALLGALAAIDGFRVDAVEPSEHRADLVRKTTQALPVTVHVADGRESGLEPGFDRVLVDAPCTGLGALRRRPEARWRRQPSDVAGLVRLQRELLAAATALVRPGGVIVYSTCSPHLSETVGVVADAVRRHGLEQLDTRDLVPGVPHVGDGPAVQLWPHRHGTDAMFLAALTRE